MKKKNLKEARSTYTLREMKKRGVKSVLWSLTQESFEYYSTMYRIEPEVYMVTTRVFQNKKTLEKSSLLRDLHYARLNGKKNIVTKLKKGQKALLDDFEIKYHALKYRIYLN